LKAPWGVAVDSAKNVYLTDLNNDVLELPWIGTGYGSQTILPFSTSSLAIAVDHAGDLFLNGNPVLELPWTGAGYGPEIALPSILVGYPGGIAVASADDVFVADQARGVLEIQRNSVNLGTANVCAPGQTIPVPCSQTLTLNFSVNAKVTLGSPNVLTGGEPGRDFTLASGNTCTGVLEKGTPCTVTVTFAPLGAGARSGAVEIVDDGGTVLAITPLHGFGVEPADAPPVVQLSAPQLEFGTVAVGATETLPLSIINIGGGTLTIASASIKGGTYVITGNTCAEGLSTGQSCTVQVQFSPPTPGAHIERLTLQTNGGEFIVSLYGKAVAQPVAPPAAKAQPVYLQFGTVTFGTSETLPVIVTNTGGGALSVVPSISGYNSSPPSKFSYSIASNDCGPGLTSGNSCAVQVQFSPTSISANHDDLLTLQTNGGNLTVNLVGAANGLSVLGGVSGGSLHYGSISAGSTKVLMLTVTNVGLPGKVTVGTAVTIGTAATPTTTYTVLATSQNTCLAGIAAGQSCTLPVEFAPTSSGTHDDLLTLTPSTGGGSTNLWLIGSTP
jgi:hypothetical protein